MFSKVLLIETVFITIIFFLSLYLDLKFRKIPNKYLKIFFIFVLSLNIIEFLVYYKDFLLIFILKIFFFFFIFLIILLLFSLKIIGGSDGKLIILIFLIHPFKFLNFYFIVSFFLLFSLQFLLVFFLNFIINKVTDNSFSFNFLFIIYPKIPNLKRFFFKMFYGFFNLTNIKDYRNNKTPIKCSSIIYNINKGNLQFLAQYRPPLVLFIIFSYYTIFFLNIGI